MAENWLLGCITRALMTRQRFCPTLGTTVLPNPEPPSLPYWKATLLRPPSTSACMCCAMTDQPFLASGVVGSRSFRLFLRMSRPKVSLPLGFTLIPESRKSWLYIDRLELTTDDGLN